MPHRLAWILVLWVLSSGALSQQAVTFPQAPSERLPVWRGYGEQVEAVLTLPSDSAGRVPAVVLIHAAGSYNHAHYEFYGAALRQAGIATLGVILFRAPSRTHVPTDLVPHAFGALKYLATHPRIDPDRIGITGFSLGGILAMYTASSMLAAEHLGTGPRFAAHVPVYPVCRIHEEVARNAERLKRIANAYANLTGAPVHILAGGRDQLEDPDSCQKFLDALSPEARKFVALTVYPNATHNWDVGRDYRYFDRGGCNGKGCQVDVVSSVDVAQKGRQFMVDFFVSNLRRSKPN
jgi:dienelactone hydrolase